MNLQALQPYSKNYTGNLLLAHPALQSEVFRHSVIGIARYHSGHGAVGVVLNKPLRLTLEDFDPEKWCGLADIPVFDGGPVGKNMLIISGLEWHKSQGILRWYFDLSHKTALDMARRCPSVVLKAFVGYTGWGDGQLENEVQTHSWIVAPMAPDYIFASSIGHMWQDLMMHFHPQLTVSTSLPADPSLN
jgi:putative transcriptional regulator